MKKIPAVELTYFLATFSQRAPHFWVHVRFINLGLTNAFWILFIQNKTRFAVSVTAFLLLSIFQFVSFFYFQKIQYF